MSISTFNQHVLKPSLHRFMDFHGAFVQAWVVMILTLRRTKAPFRRAASSCWEVPAPVLSLQRWSAGIVNEPRQRAKIGGARSGCYENVRTTLNSIGPWLGVTFYHCFVFFIISIPWVARWHFWAHWGYGAKTCQDRGHGVLSPGRGDHGFELRSLKVYTANEAIQFA